MNDRMMSEQNTVSEKLQPGLIVTITTSKFNLYLFGSILVRRIVVNKIYKLLSIDS